MKEYKKIDELSKFMMKEEDLVGEMDKMLDKVSNDRDIYKELISYYYSDGRFEDLQAYEENEIPKEINCGVLGEDEVYDLLSKYDDLALKMIEVGLNMLKNNKD